MEGARIYAANAIREKNQSLKFLQLSSRIDAVASRVQTAVNMNTLTKDMIKVTKGMKGVLRTMNPERITKVMDKFEQQFEDLDVVSAYQESAMDQNSSMVTPEGEVDTLMQQVADEHEVNHHLEPIHKLGIVRRQREPHADGLRDGDVDDQHRQERIPRVEEI